MRFSTTSRVSMGNPEPSGFEGGSRADGPAGASHPGSGGDSQVTRPCVRSTSVIPDAPPSVPFAPSSHWTVYVFFFAS